MRRILLAIFICYAPALFAQLDNLNTPLFRKLSAEKDSLFLSNLGKPYPSFTAKTLEGKTLTEQALLGKVTLINCWFEGCAPCIAELGELSSLFRKYQVNPAFQLLSFSKDYPETAKNAVQKFQIPYPVCPVPLKECYRLNLDSGFPTNIIVDQKGNIAYLINGSTSRDRTMTDVQLLEQKISALLRSPENAK